MQPLWPEWNPFRSWFPLPLELLHQVWVEQQGPVEPPLFEGYFVFLPANA